MSTTIYSYGGNVFGDDYSGVILSGAGIALPETKAILIGVTGAWPRLAGLERPGRRIVIGVSIDGADKDALREDLLEWFDPEDETSKALVIQDAWGANKRQVMAICEKCQPFKAGGNITKNIYIISLAVDGDVRWRASTLQQDIWNITATGQQRVIANDGKCDAYPIFTIEPTSTKSGGYNYKRWVPFIWKSINSTSDYPVMIGPWATGPGAGTPVGDGKMQVDGDDLRVFVDGVEVDRWIYGINAASTKIWALMSFDAAVDMTLATAIGSGDTVTEIEVNEDITALPSAGIILINSEAFVYTGKSNSLRKFTGVTRAAKGTSAGSHSQNDTVYWIQRDVWLYYGNATATAPSVDDSKKPVFSLSQSTNDQWVYTEFGEDGASRAGAWDLSPLRIDMDEYDYGCYSDLHRALTSPWAWGGGWVSDTYGAIVGVGPSLTNPCGIVNVTITTGEKMYRSTRYSGATWLNHCRYLPRNSSYWTTFYDIPQPSVEDTWESWSYSGSDFSSVASKIFLATWRSGTWIGFSDATVDLYTTETPDHTINDEQANYSLDCTITNVTTGDAITISYTMGLNEELEINTDEHTVIDLQDGSRQIQALTLVGGARRDWLPLQPGDNTLQFDDAGTAGLTLTTEWYERYRQ